MASYFKPKDKKIRHIVSEAETNRFKLQFFLRNSSLSITEKQTFLLTQSTKLGKALAFSVRSRNRCVITGRAGSVFRYFRLSRITLKQLASRGFLTGIRKSSW